MQPRVTLMRPRVTLKLATSLDGRIATGFGESQWITGDEARLEGHRLRSTHDAVLVGITTALTDDPLLTARAPGHAGPGPARVVLDSRQRISRESRLVQTAKQWPTLVMTILPPDKTLVQAGVKVIRVHVGKDGRPSLRHVLTALRGEGLTSVLIEGGGEVAATFLRADAVDRIEWFRAPILLGAEGRPCVGALAIGRLGEAPRFRRIAVQPLGPDLWERYERA